MLLWICFILERNKRTILKVTFRDDNNMINMGKKLNGNNKRNKNMNREMEMIIQRIMDIIIKQKKREQIK